MAQVHAINAATSRRSFLVKTAGAAASAAAATVVSQPAFAATTESLDSSEASPALREAVVALRESHERLEAAKARFHADDARLVIWDAENPRPTASKRAIKRWARKMREHRWAVEGESWDAQIAAEENFQDAQLAVAKVTPRDMADLELKAAVAFIYDKEKTGRGAFGLISYGVALDLCRRRMARPSA